MFIKQIRLSETAKDKLSRLKGKTGIQNWNILCRWAFCYSLKEGSIPVDVELGPASNLEMSWSTFGGQYSYLYEAVLKNWCLEKNLETDDETLAKYFRLHLERGISYLSGTGLIKSVSDLMRLIEE